MMTRTLLMVSAAVEASVGLALLASPSLVARLLLATSLDGPAAAVGRMTGAALLSLGVACWLLRGDGHDGGGRELTVAMLLYNVAAVVVLCSAGEAGLLLWPTVALHLALAIWCVGCWRSGR